MSRASASSRLIRVVIVAFLLLASSRPAIAQTGTATINGQVTDESRAVEAMFACEQVAVLAKVRSLQGD